MSLVLLLQVFAAVCPASLAAPGTPGLAAVAPLPSAEAMRLNAEGKRLYRLERWVEAQEKYRASLAADPDFLGAGLNLACALSRQSRYAEAADEAARLIRHAYVPWGREVVEAADLGILQDRGDWAKIEAARAEARVAWGKRVRDGVLFVARTKPPVNVDHEGVLVLGLAQEIFAWIPETGRYFQLTAEDGRVLALARSADGNRVAYLLAGKLIRLPGQTALLRGLSLRVLDVPTMSQTKSVAIPGDVGRVRLWFSTKPELSVTDALGATTGFRVVGDMLEPAPAVSPPARADSVVLTGLGVEAKSRRSGQPGCRFDLSARKDADGIWRIQVSRPGMKAFPLDARYGAGLSGLPFPSDTSRHPTATPGPGEGQP
jgi:hypothetical protein